MRSMAASRYDRLIMEKYAHDYDLIALLVPLRSYIGVMQTLSDLQICQQHAVTANRSLHAVQSA